MEDFNSKYSGEQVEKLLDQVANGGMNDSGSSSNGDDNRYFANFTVEEFIEAVKNYSDITDDTEDLLAALNAGKILCIPYQDVDSGYVIATYKYIDGNYTYIEITVDASTYLAYIDNSYYTLSGLSAFLIATNISYIRDTEVEIDCVDNTIYIAQKPLSDLAVYASNDAPIGVSIRFVPAEGFTLQLPSNALWVNGVVPTIESGVMYELFIATTTKILAGLVPFKSV